MALIAAHLNAGVILVVTVQSTVSLFRHLLGSRGGQYLFRDNSALNLTQPTDDDDDDDDVEVHLLGCRLIY